MQFAAHAQNARLVERVEGGVGGMFEVIRAVRLLMKSQASRLQFDLRLCPHFEHPFKAVDFGRDQTRVPRDRRAFCNAA